MRKKTMLMAIMITIMCTIASQAACKKSANNSDKTLTMQGPAVAGQFYPSSAKDLKNMVENDLAQAPQKQFDGEIIGLIVPHAGYQYSGPIAAAGFKQIQGKTYKRVVVMGISHQVPIHGAALSTKDVYHTPLGDIPIDTAAVKTILKKYSWASDDQNPYKVEHSLEVELPFLQTTLKNFILVPLLIGMGDKNTFDDIATALNSEFPDNDTLFVASTDLSHYHPYDEAVNIDRKTIKTVCDEDTENYAKALADEKIELCGSSPVYIMKKIAAMRNAKLNLVQYANSGDTAGDRSRVVGYAAIAVVMPQSSKTLSDAQKAELLKLARTTLDAHVSGKKLPPLPSDNSLKVPGAAFVTLRKHGELRGCIGQIIARGSLDKTVQDMTMAAASEDPRFPPVKPNELKDIDLEISVLTPPEELPDPLSVRVGTDGLIIEKDYHRGVLLPQVPTEQGWNKTQYLEGLAQKAGLPKDGWHGAKFLRFQAIVFGEKSAALH